MYDHLDKLIDQEIEKQLHEIYGGSFLSNVKNLFTNSESASTERAVKKYGDWLVSDLRIHRTPVEKVLQQILNAISLGEFNKSKYQYDEIYHLYLYMKVTSPNGETKYLMTEKSPNIGWSERSSLHSDSSKGNDLSLSPKPVLFSDMINSTKQKLGKDFSRYSATNNCQVWILNLVKSIYELGGSAIPKSVQDFIFQDIEPYLTNASKKTANVLTGLSHAVNRLLGKGKRRKYKRQK